MLDRRVRWGALAWVLTLQFFAAEAVAALGYPGYSYVDDVISELGSGASPAARVMNTSFVVQGVLIAAGTLLLRPALRPAGRLTTGLLLAAALGVLVVGLVPLDGLGELHAAGATAYLVGGALGMLAVASVLRTRSEPLGSALAVLGVAAAAGTAFYALGVTRVLGEGGTERVAAYPLPLALAATAVALLRGLPATGHAEDDAGPSRRELRTHDRARRAAAADARAAERDAALQDHAPGAGRRTAEPGDDPSDDPTSDPTVGPPDEDPWARPRRDG